MDQKNVSLSLSIGTIITEEHVEMAYKEARSYPADSYARYLFTKLAENLRDRMEQQNKWKDKGNG